MSREGTVAWPQEYTSEEDLLCTDKPQLLETGRRGFGGNLDQVRRGTNPLRSRKRWMSE